MVERWHDELALINEATGDICSIYKRERSTANPSPWLPVYMMEGARLTADAATIVVAIIENDKCDVREHTNRLVGIRNAMSKMRRMMVEQFGE